MTVKTEKEVAEQKEPSKEEKKKPIWTSEEKENCKSEYGCELIVDNGSMKDVTIRQAPIDAFIVKYVHEGEICFDLTRGSRYKLFDMYWDKFKGGLQSIDYGKGTIKPQSWGYTPPQQKKKRK
jgi:hypothetical protein